MTSVEKRIVRVAQWGGDIMFKNIALAAILAVAVTGSALRAPETVGAWIA